MPVDSKQSPGEKAVSAVLPPQTPGPPPEEPEKVIPAKGDPGYDTPSGYALAKVGEFKGDASEDPEGAADHGLKYLAVKMAKRWGYGSA